MGREWSDTVLEHFRNPRYGVPLPWPHGTAWARSQDESKFIRIQVCLTEERVSAVGFSTYGCAPAIACGSWVCEWAAGRAVSDVNRLTAEQVIEALGGLPEHRREHATLSVRALQTAVASADVYLRKGNAAS